MNHPHLRTLLTFAITPIAAAIAWASPITVTKRTDGLVNKTMLGINVDAANGAAAAGEVLTITYTDTGGTTRTITGTLGGLGLSNFDFVAKPGTTVTVTNTTEGTAGTVVALADDVFSPPGNTVVSAFSLGAGSSLSLAGRSFALGGGFTAIDTRVDYDPLSPTYGAEGGALHDMAITGSDGTDTVALLLGSVPTYTLDLASLWADATAGLVPLGGLSAPVHIALDGSLVVGLLTVPFSGHFDGRVLFRPDGSTAEEGTFELATALGPARGTLNATAVPRLVAVPEPGAAGLAALALAGLGLSARSARRKAPSCDRRSAAA